MILNVKTALKFINKELEQLDIPEQPSNLYDPVRYILSNGGKRIRPVLALLSCNMFTDDYLKALKPAVGIEIFHNFTLLHDDLMDNSPVRRNESTVHTRWTPNIAILSGDVMSILASKLISNSENNSLPEILSIFNNTALQVCEGQMMDMDFETRTDVTVDEYIKMIGLKTSVLIAASLQIGAVAGGADKKTADDLYDFGYKMGIGFQLQDDLFDTFSDTGKFGKKIGNDILTNKKTYLVLKALELSGNDERKILLKLFSEDTQDPEGKIKIVKDIFELLNVRVLTEKIIEKHFTKSFKIFDDIPIPDDRKINLRKFALEIMNREK